LIQRRNDRTLRRFSLAVDLSAKKQGAAGITTAAPYVAGQLGQGDDRLR
jgi:hypothetical protein